MRDTGYGICIFAKGCALGFSFGFWGGKASQHTPRVLSFVDKFLDEIGCDYSAAAV
jgi:hypothetical protein